jgi:glycosyltransferase involved in cell wall biosynthesis
MTRPERERRGSVVMTHDYPPLSGGGLALNVRELADLLAKEYDVTVLSARLRDHFADDRSRCHADPDTRGVTFRQVTVRRLVRAVARADLLIAHWTFSFRWLSTLTIMLGPLLRKPTVCVIHTAPHHLSHNRLRHLPRWLKRCLLALARREMSRCVVVALTWSQAAALTAARLPVTHVLPLMVSLAPLGGRLPTAALQRSTVPTIGIVGELSRVKGSERIPALVRTLAPVYAFRIAGSGPLAGWLLRQIDQLPTLLRESVSMTGHLRPEEMAEFYPTVDVLLVPSRSEAQPRTILEAMLSGVIVVAPQQGDGFDLVVDGRTGVLVDVDDLLSVRQKIALVTKDAARSAALRRNAFEFARMLLRDSRMPWTTLVAGICGTRGTQGVGIWPSISVAPKHLVPIHSQPNDSPISSRTSNSTMTESGETVSI